MPQLTALQKDMERALRAVSNTGHKVDRMVIGPDGAVVIHLGEPSNTPNMPEANEWDE